MKRRNGRSRRFNCDRYYIQFREKLCGSNAHSDHNCINCLNTYRYRKGYFLTSRVWLDITIPKNQATFHGWKPLLHIPTSHHRKGSPSWITRLYLYFQTTNVWRELTPTNTGLAVLSKKWLVPINSMVPHTSIYMWLNNDEPFQLIAEGWAKAPEQR